VQCEASLCHFPIFQKSPSSPGPHDAPLQFLCYPSFLSHDLDEILLVALSCKSSLSAKERLNVDVCVSVLKMFPPRSDTAGTLAGIYVHHEFARRWLLPGFPLKRNSITALQRNDVSVTAIFSQCMTEHKKCACADFAFMLERKSAANILIMPVMKLPTISL
jgi:hypothetical protein